jgi:putative polyhydroxyalkanoate system protein
MATIDIKRSHSLPLDQARQRAEELAKSMEERFEIVWKWEGDTIAFHAPKGAAKGTKGEVVVSASDVRVAIDLPLMLRVMKGTIEEKVNDKLQKLL